MEQRKSRLRPFGICSGPDSKVVLKRSENQTIPYMRDMEYQLSNKLAKIEANRDYNPTSRKIALEYLKTKQSEGLGQVLYEGIDYSEDGTLLTKDLFDAGLPISENTPKFTLHVVENPSALPHGAKGLGESPTIGVPLALTRAIEKVSGKRMRSTPIRPEMLIDQ
jgi:hypothetical protein